MERTWQRKQVKIVRTFNLNHVNELRLLVKSIVHEKNTEDKEDETIY